jgi:hypothetical protein
MIILVTFMKRTSLQWIALLLCFFTACKKQAAPAPHTGPDTVRYRYTADFSAKFNLAYTGGNNVDISTYFIGPSWTETVIRTSPDFKIADFVLEEQTTPVPQGMAEVTIFVNGKAVSDQQVPFGPLQSRNFFCYAQLP